QRMRPLERATSPFAERVKPNTPAVWLKPSLVANVKFTEWTSDGHMRHPVFDGLRVDKTARDVHKEPTTTMATKKSASRKSGKTTTRAKAAPKQEDERPSERIVRANGHEVKLTNQNKVFWPKEGFTKGDVADYYARMSTWILPYLKDRPQSLKRNPGGINDP